MNINKMVKMKISAGQSREEKIEFLWQQKSFETLRRKSFFSSLSENEKRQILANVYRFPDLRTKVQPKD